MATEEEVSENDESLIALTTHFAQVQFRLKQIISADAEHKEALLKDLEQFAFQGCGKQMTYDTAASGENGSTEAQRLVRIQLMEKLRNQLDDIEKCAQEAVSSESVASGSDDQSDDRAEGNSQRGVVSSIAEKQRIIIDELRKRFDFQFGDLERLSNEEVKKSVGKAVREVVDPIKSNEDYVSHLQSQIKDLERYIAFLQVKQPSSPLDYSRQEHVALPLFSPSATPSSATPRVLPDDAAKPLLSPEKDTKQKTKHVTFADDEKNFPFGDEFAGPVPQYRLSMAQLDGVDCTVDSTRCEWEKMDSLGSAFYQTKTHDDLRLSLMVMKKTLAVMKVLTLCECGGSFQCLPKYVADGKRKRYHLALHSLEMAVDKITIISTALNETGLSKESKISLETDLHETVSMLLSDSLRVLLEHGLLANGKPVSLTSGCFPAWKNWGFSGKGVAGMGLDCPAWQVFMYYFKMKNGRRFSSRTDQLLTTSFAIPVNSSSVKKTLLSTINMVSHTYSSCMHCSPDTKFRSLICEGFNLKHLSEWFKALASNPSIGDDLYSSSSFLTTTGFRPAIACLERLKDNPPCEPVVLPQSYYQCTDAFLRA